MKKHSYRNWWTYTLKGVFALAFGMVALLVKEASDDWLVMLFGGFIILGGFFLGAGAICNLKQHVGLALWLFEGLVDIAMGIIMIIYHKLHADLDQFFIFVATWAISVGFIQLLSAIIINKGVKTKWLLWLNALVLITASILLYISLYETADQSMNMIVTVAVTYGVFITIYSIQRWAVYMV